MAGNHPHEFSGGQRQRIAIARASSPPKPSSSSATSRHRRSMFRWQAQILNLMRDLQDKFGLTYLFISHKLAVVRPNGDPDWRDVISAASSRSAPARELSATPRMPYTKMLLGRVCRIWRCPAASGFPSMGEIPNPIDPTARMRIQPALPAGLRPLPQTCPGADRWASPATRSTVRRPAAANSMITRMRARPCTGPVGRRPRLWSVRPAPQLAAQQWIPMSNINPDPFTDQAGNRRHFWGRDINPLDTPRRRV